MYTWLFQGNLGEGKTFGMAVMANWFKVRARRAGIDVDLFSNFELMGAHDLRSYRDFYTVARSDSSIVLLDEAHSNLDSRLFSRGSNIYMTQFFFFLRKLHCSLFMTTPNIRNLDSRIRQLLNILVDCHKMGGGFLYDIYDCQGERLITRKYMPAVIAKAIMTTGMYKTDAMIRAVEFPSTERAFDRFLENIINIREGNDVRDMDAVEEENYNGTGSGAGEDFSPKKRGRKTN